MIDKEKRQNSHVTIVIVYINTETVIASNSSKESIIFSRSNGIRE